MESARSICGSHLLKNNIILLSFSWNKLVQIYNVQILALARYPCSRTLLRYGDGLFLFELLQVNKHSSPSFQKVSEKIEQMNMNSWIPCQCFTTRTTNPLTYASSTSSFIQNLKLPLQSKPICTLGIKLLCNKGAMYRGNKFLVLPPTHPH